MKQHVSRPLQHVCATGSLRSNLCYGTEKCRLIVLFYCILTWERDIAFILIWANVFKVICSLKGTVDEPEPRDYYHVWYTLLWLLVIRLIVLFTLKLTHKGICSRPTFDRPLANHTPLLKSALLTIIVLLASFWLCSISLCSQVSVHSPGSDGPESKQWVLAQLDDRHH